MSTSHTDKTNEAGGSFPEGHGFSLPHDFGRKEMWREGERYLIDGVEVERGRAMAEQIDLSFPDTHSFHEHDAGGDRNRVHVITDRSRREIQRALKGEKFPQPSKGDL